MRQDSGTAQMLPGASHRVATSHGPTHHWPVEAKISNLAPQAQRRPSPIQENKPPPSPSSSTSPSSHLRFRPPPARRRHDAAAAAWRGPASSPGRPRRAAALGRHPAAHGPAAPVRAPSDPAGPAPAADVGAGASDPGRVRSGAPTAPGGVRPGASPAPGRVRPGASPATGRLLRGATSAGARARADGRGSCRAQRGQDALDRGSAVLDGRELHLRVLRSHGGGTRFSAPMSCPSLYESSARGSLRSVPIAVGFNAHVYERLIMSLAVDFNLFVSSTEYDYSMIEYHTYSGFRCISSDFRFIRA